MLVLLHLLPQVLLPIIFPDGLQLQFFFETLIRIFYMLTELTRLKLQNTPLALDHVYDVSVSGLLGEFLEVWVKLQKVFFGGDGCFEVKVLMVGLFAKEIDVVGMANRHVENVGDVGGDVLEDEHNIVPSIQVLIFIPFQS